MAVAVAVAGQPQDRWLERLRCSYSGQSRKVFARLLEGATDLFAPRELALDR